MTKKQLEDLNQVKRSALKINLLVKKIDESDKEGMTHRHTEYKEELKKESKKMNEFIEIVCQ